MEAQRFLGLTCRELLELLAVLIALAVAEALLPSPRYVVGLITGVVLTASLAIVGFAFLLSGDATFPIAGAIGETRTQAVLDAAKQQGLIWSAVINIEVGRCDVDHLALTPAGLLAIESKWRFKGADQRSLSGAADSGRSRRTPA